MTHSATCSTAESRFILPDWPAPSWVQAWTTSRSGGFSTGPFQSFNLAGHVGDDPACVDRNREKLAADLGLPREPEWLEQSHGSTVVAASGTGNRPQADACWSDCSGRVCAVLTADCLPVLLTSLDQPCIAAAHAGWRGLAGGVLETCVSALPVAPERLIAWLGPAIGPAAFEVGEEVRAAFLAERWARAAAFSSGAPGRWFADLYGLARMQLGALGLGAVYGGDYCTYRDRERFFSYRREATTGRMATVIWIVPP
jgi:YfiH family protein